MVVVDMGPTREQIAKRARRRRRIVRRNMKRVRLREEANAIAALEARQKAIQTWEEEEQRLESLRQQKQTSKSTPSRLIRFSDQVQVTTIPSDSNISLPPPSNSPIGLALMPRISDDDDDDDNDNTDDGHQHLSSPSTAQGLVLDAFRKLIAGDFNDDDDDDDPEFQPPDQSDVIYENDNDQQNIQSKPVPFRRERRKRDVVKSLASTFENSSPDIDSTKLKQSAILGKRSRSDDDSNDQVEKENKDKKQDNDHEMKSSKDNFNSSDKDDSLKQNGHTHKTIDTTPAKKRKVVVSQASSTNSLIKLQTNNQLDDDQNDKNLHDPPSPDTNPQTENKNQSPNKMKATVASPNDDSSKKRKKRKKKKKSLSFDQEKAVIVHVNGDTREDKPSPSVSSSEDIEIDDIFDTMTKKRASMKAEQAIKAAKLEQQKIEQGKDKQTSFGKKKKSQGVSRYTDDGLRIMTYADIAADQPKDLNGDCPFDCSCCF